MHTYMLLFYFVLLTARGFEQQKENCKKNNEHNIHICCFFSGPRRANAVVCGCKREALDDLAEHLQEFLAADAGLAKVGNFGP